MQEAWDGPALLVFTDGKKLGCRLDRNGLRPARFWRTADDYIYVASEVGVLGDVISNAENIVAKGRLGPGQMIQADLETGDFKENTEVAKEVASRCDYKSWLSEIEDVHPHRGARGVSPRWTPSRSSAQAAAGYAAEDVTMIIESMAQNGGEPTWSMGDDTPMPVLSGRPHLLYDYFKQRFAQVTNPAIDPLREGLVMSLEMTIGAKGNLLNNDGAKDIPAVSIKSPVLFDEDADAVMAVKGLNAKRVAAFSPTTARRVRSDPASTRSAPSRRRRWAMAASASCSRTSPLRGRRRGDPVAARRGRRAPPSHQAWVSAPARPSWSSRRGVHAPRGVPRRLRRVRGEPVAGARDVPRVAHVQEGGERHRTRQDAQHVRRRRAAQLQGALNAGLKKILSKMGISLLTSYHGAQIFECYGLGPELIDTAFKGTVSRVGGSEHGRARR